MFVPYDRLLCVHYGLLHFQFRISSMSWPSLSMYFLCSISSIDPCPSSDVNAKEGAPFGRSSQSLKRGDSRGILTICSSSSCFTLATSPRHFRSAMFHDARTASRRAMNSRDGFAMIANIIMSPFIMWSYQSHSQSNPRANVSRYVVVKGIPHC